MQINITNGTLTQVQETLTASSGYTLPTTISVSGATSNYNSTTGAITLTNLTQTMSITASGETTGTNNIWLGTTKLAKAFVGNSEIASMWLGNTKIYEKGGASSGLNVNVVFQNSVGTNRWVKTDVYDRHPDNPAGLPSNLLYSFESVDGSTNVNTTTNALCIHCQSTRTIVDGTITCSNGITYDGRGIDSNSENAYYMFSVEDDGAITIDGINWNF